MYISIQTSTKNIKSYRLLNTSINKINENTKLADSCHYNCINNYNGFIYVSNKLYIVVLFQ